MKGNIFNLSIDNITMMCHMDKKSKEKFQKMIYTDNQIKLHKEGYEVTGMICEKIFFSINSRFKNTKEFRIEFNPNNLTELETDYLKQKILPLVKNPHLSRLDVAFDCDFDLSNCNYIQENSPKKKTIIEGKNGKIETIYFGVRGSEEQIRIYNKKIQMEEVLEEKTDLEHWWRVEFQFRKEYKTGLTHVNRDDELFKNLRIVQFNLPEIKNIETLGLVMLFKENEHLMNTHIKDSRTKTKYKKLLLECSEVDITEEFEKKYKQKKSDLHYQITQWLSACQRSNIK